MCGGMLDVTAWNFFLKHLGCWSVSLGQCLTTASFSSSHWTSSLASANLAQLYTWTFIVLICAILKNTKMYYPQLEYEDWEPENIGRTLPYSLMFNFVFSGDTGLSTEIALLGDLFWHQYRWWINMEIFASSEWVKDRLHQPIFYEPRENISKCEWNNKITVSILM